MQQALARAQEAQQEREQLIILLAREKLTLAESEQRYRIMGEILPYGIWLCDSEGKAIYTSQSFLDLIDMSMEEMQGLGWTQRLVPEDVEPIQPYHYGKRSRSWVRTRYPEAFHFEYRHRVAQHP